LTLLSAVVVVPAAAEAKQRPPETHHSTSPTESKLKGDGALAAHQLNRRTRSYSSRGARISRRRNKRVTVRRALRNTRAVARDVYLADVPAFDYGTARASDCRRRSRSNVACWGWVDTYPDDDYLHEYPLTCWFKVRTVGGRRGFRVSFYEDSVYCESQV
jgi:hypothetical protein